VVGKTASSKWVSDAGGRPLPLAVLVRATLRGETTDVGRTSVVTGTRVSTLGWLDDKGRVLAVDPDLRTRVTAAGEKVRLKFDVDDGNGDAVKETLQFTFILEREGAPGAFSEVARFTDTATGIQKFEREFTTPDDASVPATFRIALEVRRPGETGAPSLGRRLSPPLRVIILAPTISSFLATEPSSGSADPRPMIALGPGQQARLFWDVLGAFDDVRLSPGDFDLTKATSTPHENAIAGAATVDPAKVPPDKASRWTLVAKHKGLASEPRTVIVVAITELVITLPPSQPGTGPHVLTLRDGTSVVPELRAVAKKPGEALDRRGNDFVGQITPGSNVKYSYKVVGAEHVIVRLKVSGGVITTGTTDSAELTAELRKNGGAGSLELRDKSPGAVLDAELLLLEDVNGAPGDVLARAVLRVRENFPMPKLTGFTALDDGSPVADGGTVSSWAKLQYRWNLSGSSTFNRLEVTFTGPDGKELPPETFKGAGDGRQTGDKAPAVGPFSGKVVAHARLLNMLNDVQGEKTVTVTVKPPPVVVPPPPPGDPPKMRVGFNYPWAFEDYGFNFGPNPNDAAETDRRWKTSVPRNLAELKGLGITLVRWFLMPNGFNYGKLVKHTTGGFFDPFGNYIPEDITFSFDPVPLDPQFTRDFEIVLGFFKDAGMQLIPSFIDFPWSAQGGTNNCQGRAEVLTNATKRKKFLDETLEKYLTSSKKFPDQIFAWEVINEPAWNVQRISPPLHRTFGTPDLSDSELTAFLDDAITRIKAAGFESTVGHRFDTDLTKFPTGTKPQFHFYSQDYTYLGVQFADPFPIPSAAKTKAFVGEIGTAPSVHGGLWPECDGADSDPKNTIFERLKVIARKGYDVCLLWPSIKDPGGDTLKLTADQKKSIERFTKGRFPKGVP